MKTVSLEPANFELLELYHRDVQSLNQPFGTAKHLYLSNHFTKKSAIVREIFLQFWKSDFVGFLQITGNKCIQKKKLQ